MASRGIASYSEPDGSVPSKRSLATPFVQGFRELLAAALQRTDAASGKKLGQCIGVYAFYDYDGEPIYVGQTWEGFGTRVGRHLTGQRSDTLAYRILDPFEVAEFELYPVEELRADPDKRAKLDAVEYSVYLDAIERSKYRAILNEKIPPLSTPVPLPASYRFALIPETMREDREHPDVRIARRAETLARVAAVAHERGEVSAGLRRVIVIQAVRLADLAAARLSYAEGRRRPPATAIDVPALVGNVTAETDRATADPAGDDPTFSGLEALDGFEELGGLEELEGIEDTDGVEEPGGAEEPGGVEEPDPHEELGEFEKPSGPQEANGLNGLSGLAAPSGPEFLSGFDKLDGLDRPGELSDRTGHAGS